MESSGIDEGTRFKEDLEADSLDLVELVMELEDRYGIRITDEEAERIETVGQAIDFVLSHAPLPRQIPVLSGDSITNPRGRLRGATDAAGFTPHAQAPGRQAWLGA